MGWATSLAIFHLKHLVALLAAFEERRRKREIILGWNIKSGKVSELSHFFAHHRFPWDFVIAWTSEKIERNKFNKYSSDRTLALQGSKEKDQKGFATYF
jgi:hypothetical protein